MERGGAHGPAVHATCLQRDIPLTLFPPLPSSPPTRLQGYVY